LRNDPHNTAIVTAVVALAQPVGLSTTAEGIEDQRCAELLQKLGCEEGQGFYFGKPMPVGQIEELLGTRNDPLDRRQAVAA
jgi:EAL domain-containing protein (putative c-di-GMP-specific phosphodiesterase class I)